MGLHHCRAAVDVDDESRQAVAFAVNEAVDVVVFPMGEPERLAKLEGLGEPLQPKMFVDGLVAECEHSHSNGAYLAVAVAEEVAAVGHDAYQVALGGMAVAALDGSREYPRVEAS